MSEKYKKIEKIGEGTYGIVYKAIERKSKRIVALKKIRLDNETEGVPSTTIREISLLKTIKSPNIIELIDVIHNTKALYLVFEYIDMDLRAFLDNCYQSERLLSSDIIKKMSFQMLTALNQCHSRGILHRDLKPQNILITKELDLKLADFGLGRCVSLPLRTFTKEIVTLWYRSPELLLGQRHYSIGVDTWALGCIMAELYLFKPLFPGDSEIDQLYKIFKILGTPTKKQWEGCRKLPNWVEEFPDWKAIELDELICDNTDFLDILKELLIYDPMKRIDAKCALKYAFFTT